MKVIRCAFKGGPSTGNNVTVQIGSNNTTPGASNILIEDSWVYGCGCSREYFSSTRSRFPVFTF